MWPPPSSGLQPLPESAAGRWAEQAASAWLASEAAGERLPLVSLLCYPDPWKYQPELREKCQCCPKSDSHSTGGSEEEKGLRHTGTQQVTRRQELPVRHSPVNWAAETGRLWGSVCYCGCAQTRALAQSQDSGGCGKARWLCRSPVKNSRRRTLSPPLTVSWCWGPTTAKQKHFWF